MALVEERREEAGGGLADRCPHPRPFPADFTACPSFQAVSFVAADSLNRPLPSGVTCRHLAVQRGSRGRGQFYARCALGGEAARRRWPALVGPARLDVIRALQAEFDAATGPHRRALVAARASQVRPGEPAVARAELRHRLDEFHVAVEAFLRSARVRFEDVGLSVESLQQLIEDWSRAWLANVDAGDPALDGDGRGGFPLTTPIADADEDGDGATAALPGPGEGPTLFRDDLLQVVRVGRPPGLRLEGDVDVSNAGAVAACLSTVALDEEDISLDFRGVSFCDLSGMRALVQVVHGLRPARRVELRNLPAHLHRAMQLVGWADLPTLVVVPARSSEGGRPRDGWGTA